ncbi:MAG: HD-GYP domain-containing protein [Actinobacteria bacterium]|nr:HD-GYP domain-containing protein [Actinomycetota bacterium]
MPPAVLHFVGRDKVYWGGWVHFTTVAAGAMLATVCAIALTVVGARRADARAVLVGGAFSVMAALLVLHSVTTPDILVGDNGVVAFAGGATLPVGASILALSVLPVLRRPEAVKPLLALTVVAIALVAALGVAAVLDPHLVPDVPEPASPLAWAALAVGLGFFGVLAFRALRTYLLTHRVLDLVVVVGLLWLSSALVGTLLLGYWELGWWLGHGFEIVGIALVGIPVAIDLARTAPSRALVGDLRAAELVAAEEAYLGSQVRALMVALADKDEYTEEHTRRVALRAVQVGEELGLPSPQLRSLAVGGLLHDIGKLRCPDEILKKPAPLTDEEYAVVREHAEAGRRLLKELGGFDDTVLGLVRGHHERLDGSGYPRGLTGSSIDLDTRILAVCDVYDALRSARVYREAWSHERAMRLLRSAAGDEFDARCVEALERVLGREQAAGLAVAV